MVALISHRHRALSAPSPPAGLLLPFLWWWSSLDVGDLALELERRVLDVVRVRVRDRVRDRVRVRVRVRVRRQG